MNIPRSTTGLLCAFSLTASLAQGQITTVNAQLDFEDIKNFRITGPGEFVYEGGSWDLFMGDGAIVFLPCARLDLFTFIPPNIACPSGTTGLITSGDVDGDGVRDIGTYWSIQQPIPATQVEPFQEHRIELFSAPPSRLPRPLGGFSWEDNSLVVFYDLVNDPRNGVGYEISIYNSSRPYLPTELERHREEIVPGRYTFEFPALGTREGDNRDFFIMNAFHREMVEAFPGPGGKTVTGGGISVGNDFRLLNDERWTDDDRMEFDPRIFFDFQWEGFNPQTFLAGDRVFFSIRDRDTGLIVFPPIPPGQFEFSQLIGSSRLGIPRGYELGPDFFGPGRNLEVELEFRRDLPTGNTNDRSVRWFRWDLDLIDTYAGFQSLAFPGSSSELLITESADFDGDGYTNLQEFGLSTDPADPASVPNVTPTLDPFTGQCVLNVPKRPSVGSSLTYLVQYSFDKETWTTIDQNDENWFIITDDENEISVLSRRPAGDIPCFVRVRFTNNG